MRIATWNVNGLRARFDFVLHWLRERQPDVVGLQELKVAEDRFPHAEFEAEGYHALIHSAKAWNGVAILSREPGQLKQRGAHFHLISPSLSALSPYPSYWELEWPG